jgi:hypothetical protein
VRALEIKRVAQVAERLLDDAFMAAMQNRTMLNLSLQKTTALLDKLLGDEHQDGKYEQNNVRFVGQLIDVMGQKSMVKATVLRLSDAFKRSAVCYSKITAAPLSVREELGDQAHEEECTLQLIMFLENACQAIAQSALTLTDRAASANESSKSLTAPTTVALIVGTMAKYAHNGKVQNYGLTLLARIHQLQKAAKIKDAARNAVTAKWKKGDVNRAAVGVIILPAFTPPFSSRSLNSFTLL